MIKRIVLGIVATFGVYAGDAQASTCTGKCGTLAPNGVVTAPPQYGPNYQYISTSGGIAGAGQIAGAGGTNGSEYITSAFGALPGDILNFYFNFVTSDGTGSFPDYGFAELLNGGAHAAWLFTARTTTSGNTSPGFGLPANDSTLTPGASPIIPGATTWSPLGVSSGQCFLGSGNGCGYTGWIGSSYTIDTAGTYALRFGVSNFGDGSFDTGLAFAGVAINNHVVDGVPEPASWLLMIAGFSALGATLRARRPGSSRVAFG